MTPSELKKSFNELIGDVLFAVLAVSIILIIVFSISKFYENSTESPLVKKCEKLRKTFPKDMNKDYVIEQFYRGKIQDIEKGWKDWGRGCCLDDMNYLILYYPLSEITVLEVRYEADLFDDGCNKFQYPPKIIRTGRTIWVGNMATINAKDKTYKWLKKHKEYWSI